MAQRLSGDGDDPRRHRHREVRRVQVGEGPRARAGRLDGRRRGRGRARRSMRQQPDDARGRRGPDDGTVAATAPCGVNGNKISRPTRSRPGRCSRTSAGSLPSPSGSPSLPRTSPPAIPPAVKRRPLTLAAAAGIGAGMLFGAGVHVAGMRARREAAPRHPHRRGDVHHCPESIRHRGALRRFRRRPDRLDGAVQPRALQSFDDKALARGQWPARRPGAGRTSEPAAVQSHGCLVGPMLRMIVMFVSCADAAMLLIMRICSACICCMRSIWAICICCCTSRC